MLNKTFYINVNSIVCLTPPKPSDANEIFNVISNDTDIYKWTLKIPNNYNIEEAQSWIKRCEYQMNKTGECLKWVIRSIKDNNKYIGTISIFPYSDDDNAYEIGYFISKKYRNLGIITDCINVIVENIAFNYLNLDKIYAEPFDGNISSCRVLEKTGFIKVCNKKGSYIKDNKFIDSILYVREK